VGALWSHQAALLRTYADRQHVATPDLALELPTGSGKTLVGLLIADWRRRARRHRVAYVCLTNPLARQVADAAGDNNIPAVLLTGRAREWSDRDVNLYASSKAVAITVYSHVFTAIRLRTMQPARYNP
jgi:superfamily II DNA or RNA helicase